MKNRALTFKLFRNGRGFTLVELMISVALITVIAGAAFLVLNSSARAKRAGDRMAEAQQNARAAMNAVVADLRRAGYGVEEDSTVPIEVASSYRITMVTDTDRDGIVEPGERITYFVDPDRSQDMTANTENPNDYVIRRLESTAGDTLAVPGPEKGQVVAYLVTQRSAVTAGQRDIPMFRYFDADGNQLIGTGTDVAGPEYGSTLSDSTLGLPMGSGLDKPLARIDVNLVTETPNKAGNDHTYRRFQLGAQVRPRNFAFDLVASFTVTDQYGNPIPPDGDVLPPDTTGTEDPPDTVLLPTYEPPIRIATARVLSLAANDLGERDDMEGSRTTESGQDDIDLVLGTKAGSSNNLSVWFNGQPGRYDSDTYYQNTPNYFGASAFDIKDIEIVNLDKSDSDLPDGLAAVKASDTVGGFQVWLNHPEDKYQGRLGSGDGTTSPSAYYSEGTGQGMDVATGDFDRDGDADVLLGTRTGDNRGLVELWMNNGYGQFDLHARYTASGEVNTLAVFDIDRDGYPDFAAGTKTHSDDKTGSIDVFMNSGTGFYMLDSYESSGKVNVLAIGNLNKDAHGDIIAGTKTGQNSGTVEFWAGHGSGFVKKDETRADGVVLSMDIGPIDYGNDDEDVVIGTDSREVQAWFVDPNGDILADMESWADANAGGAVHAVKIVKVEYGADEFYKDPLYDIVAGTAISTTQGEIVIYLNPYVWTLQQ